MKKLLPLVLALVMALSVSATAFAADTTINQDSAGKTGSTAVTFHVDPTYTVTIPEKVELTKVDDGGTITYESDLTVTAAAGVRLLAGEVIQVTLKSGSDFNLSTAADAAYKLPYTVTVGNNTIANDGVVATFGTNNEAQTATLHFAAGNPTYAGDYSDTVIFTLAIVNE
ncbi:MAG: hypothetical protein KHX46_03500 [Clostridiales bacterium]|nr:hypothetical protein [Clostridiales bacterium]